METRIDLQACLPTHLIRVDSQSNALVEVPSSTLEGKTVLLYFSAHWCPPCRGFTPYLARLYTILKKKGIDFELVFVSHDQDTAQFQQYFRHMAAEGGTWLAVPFQDQGRDLLATKCGVMGIPTLTVIGPDGAIVAPNARAAAAADPSGDGFPWPGASSPGGGGGLLWLLIVIIAFWILVPRVYGMLFG